MYNVKIVKLYTKQQLLLVSFASAIFAGALVAGIFFGADRPRERDNIPAFTLEENTGTQPIRPARDVAEGLGEDERQNIEIYERLNRAVVNITTETLAYSWFFEPVPREGGTGSGSIIDRRGYVLTNYHVVEGAYKVFVTLADGDRFEGEVVGTDPETDLAIVHFLPEREIETIQFGSSEDLKVGQKVLAIGNPFAFERTLTTGIVSGLGRPVRGRGRFVIQGMIQTDASINPGNSGGPLLNSRGEMIGVNTMIYSPSGGSVGIGFATPVSTAMRVVPQLIAYGKVIRGWIDISPVQLEPQLVRAANLPVDRGLLVSRVASGGEAERAGIRGGKRTQSVRWGREIIYLGGDIIVGIGGVSVESISDYFGALEMTTPGETIEVTVVRGGRRLSFDVSLTDRPNNLYGE